MNDYLDKLKSIDDRTVRALLQALKNQIRILGTNVIIEKYSQDSPHRQAFGALFQTDNFTKVVKNSFPSRYVINRNYLSDHYLKQSQTLSVYHYKPELSVGDTLTFRQDNIIYTFKVESKFSYGLSPHVLFRYELIGLPENTLNSTSNGTLNPDGTTGNGQFGSSGSEDSC